MHTISKVGALALLGALMVVLGTLRPAGETPKAEANLSSPGGIAALPSGAPAIPGLSNQSIPAMIGTGQPGIVAVFCYDQLTPIGVDPCPVTGDGGAPAGQGGRLGSITFEIEKIFPPGGGPAGLTFDANGENTLVVTDNSGADKDAAIGVVTVRVNAAAATQGGTQGVNEIVNILATDETGDTRQTLMVTVDTMLAFGATGAVSTANQGQPLFVAYHCDVTGRAPLAAGTPPWIIDPDLDGQQGLDDMYDGYYTYIYDGTGPGIGYGSTAPGPPVNPLNPNTDYPDLDMEDVWCGGNTPVLYDDFVDFETDVGLLSIRPAAMSAQAGASLLADSLGYFFPPIVDSDCGQGKSIDVADVDALSYWFLWLAVFGATPPIGPYEGGCDGDGWRNGVVATMLLGSGEVGVATITGQQGGGISPPRTVNVTFVGEPALSLFMDAPSTIGPEGAEFSVFVVDQDIRPAADHTVGCSVEPAGGALLLIPQTGTTGNLLSETPGEVIFRLVPTGAAVVQGETLTITCQLDRDRSVMASWKVTLASVESELVELVAGCNPLVATWPDATPVETVAEAVKPAKALQAIWALDPEAGMWEGYSPDAPDASDLVSVDELDAVFVCVDAAATISRPVI